MPNHLIILAAGQGTRMQSDRPKVLHEIGGVPMFFHALRSGEPLAPERKVFVVGHGADAVASAAKASMPDLEIAVQHEQLGTAHAVSMARDALKGMAGDAFVLYGDTPFIQPETLDRMARARAAGFAVVVLGFEAANPARYGRLILDGDHLTRIVEFKDATEAERKITLCNSGVIAADVSVLFELIDAVGNNNAAGEYYLTDIVEAVVANGLNATAVTCPEEETMGVNSKSDLADAEAAFQARKRKEMLENGVSLTAPDTVIFAEDTTVGRDAVVEPYVVFGPGVSVETGARIRAFSHLEGCHVGQGAIVGPYARLRPGAELANGTRIGNFVEVKNAVIGEGTKVNHLSYIGDASLGAGTNIGAGTITCNYDGVFKHRTVIGEDVFVGSNTMLVAPVTVGDGAMTASGTVITEDVPSGDLSIARAKQINKTGLGRRLMEKLRAQKAKAKG